uniref:Uncharacterized protein n=1 Tax=Romanomermis culicivorax TaxID=13658 RepID=A0A915K3X9_ROMCU
MLLIVFSINWLSWCNAWNDAPKHSRYNQAIKGWFWGFGQCKAGLTSYNKAIKGWFWRFGQCKAGLN